MINPNLYSPDYAHKEGTRYGPKQYVGKMSTGGLIPPIHLKKVFPTATTAKQYAERVYARWSCAFVAALVRLSSGPQEPPQDPRIFNRRQADGTFRPLDKFFEGPTK